MNCWGYSIKKCDKVQKFRGSGVQGSAPRLAAASVSQIEKEAVPFWSGFIQALPLA